MSVQGPQYEYRNPLEASLASNRHYADKVFLITATPETREQYSLTIEDADRTIRQARRQLARYGPEVLAGLLVWCRSDHERALVRRAVGKSARVRTVVEEWGERTKKK